MTDAQPPYPAQQPQPPQNRTTQDLPPVYAPQNGSAPVKTKPQRNVLGWVALGVAVVGFIFACIPGALILGWVLLPIGFILGIVALFLKGNEKWQGITAIIVAVVGTIIGVIVFFAVVATSFNNAFGDTDVEIGAGNDSSVTEEADEPATEEQPAAEIGTRENPAPLGAPIEADDWTVVINSVTLNAAEAIMAANPFNEAADPGTEYILVNYTVTYTGDDPDGQMPAFVGVDYVTAAGVTVDSLDKLIVAPEPMASISALYNGASATGNTAIQVPTPADGVLAVRPGMVSDNVFVAIQ